MQTFAVTEQDLGRLDQVLLKRYSLLRPGLLHRYLRENKIKVNAKKVPLSTRLTVGDTITLYIPDHALTPGLGPDFLHARDCFDVVYEDEHLLIVNKPAGLIVADETGKNVDTLINRALLYLHQKKQLYTSAKFFTMSVP